jgi:hypothetical protein
VTSPHSALCVDGSSVDLIDRAGSMEIVARLFRRRSS